MKLNMPKFSGAAQKEETNELKKILMSFKGTFAAMTLYSYIINMLMLVPSIYMLQIYDRILTSRNKETLLMITLIVVVLYMILAALEWVRSQIMIRAGNEIDDRLSDKTFNSAFHSALTVGPGAANQSFQDLTTVRQFLTGNGLNAFLDAPWIPIYIVVIYILHPALGVLATVSAIILVILTLLTEVTSKSVIKEANQEFRRANAFANTNFRNAEVIDAMGMIDNVKKHWIPKHNNFLDLQTKASTRSVAITSFTKFVRITSQSSVYFVGAYYVIKMELTPGAMIAGAILMGRALQPVEMIMGSWKNFVNARNSYNKLKQLFSEYEVENDKMELPRPEGEVVVKGLFGTPPLAHHKQVIKNVTFHVEKGDLVGVIGPSASGKSSLARLLVGVWKPLMGDVRLDGADVSKWDKKTMGKYLGYLPQDIELMEGTIAQNIARFGEVDAEKVVEAAKDAGVHDMILGFENGYDTFIGEGGAVLSGGQRQRIGLARAIYGDPVMIVLDEPNSNLDEAGEHALLKTLIKLKSLGKTVFIVTHKTQILSIVDKILMLKDATVSIFGPRNEVMAALKKRMEEAQKAAANSAAAQPAQAQKAPTVAAVNTTVPITTVKK